ncbi:DEAD/DEAH box helicase [Catalinimonas sp. 4WD22]|uniref:DEAD/DEAH box helicase n=1 Tax=Catalinimonas locisalis TaxID=3133978 RepID=UPI003100BBB2
MKTKTTRKTKKKSTKKSKVPYHKKPDNMGLEAWQIALRKQFGNDSTFEIEKLTEHPVYADFSVFNPITKSAYKVAIRSSPKAVAAGNNANFCSCYDFKTNQLGTCKHIEAVLGKLWRNTHLRKYFKESSEAPYTSVYLKYEGERKVMIRVGSENQEVFERLASQYFDENRVLKARSFASFDKFLEKAHSLHDSFRCYDDALEYVIEQREKENRHQQLRDRIKNIKSEYFNDLIKAELFPYQREGVYFAARAGRSLIADEMGLGKTIQAIAAAELMKKEFGIGRVLIICPTSLKYQWKTEIEKFTDNTSLVVEGNPLARIPQYHEDESFYKIVSYYTAGNDLKHINAHEFDLVILDEAQRIKNWKTKVSQNIKKVQSTYAIVLTGTPLENKLEELYSIMQFIDPFLLGSLFGFLNQYQITDDTGKVIGYQHLNKIGKTLQEVMIRRTKKKVLNQLPSRQDKNLFVPMTAMQHEVHQEYADVVARLVNKWKRMGFLPEKDRQRLMISLNMMRMSCNSTYIIDQRTRHDTKVDELMSILEEILEVQEEKVVIFSQWERMTRLVAQELDEKGIKYEYLHGGVPSAQRKDLFKNFNQDPETVVFLSTDAGGVGLNLQAASYMINLDIPWNPATLEQRIARIYRMGQKRKVSIINLVSSGTIEHRMLDVLKFKSTMAEGVLDQGEDAIFMSESRFKQFMNSVENVVPGTAEGAVADTGFVQQEEEREAIAQPEESTHEVTAELFMEEEDAPANGKAQEVKRQPGTADTEAVPMEGAELLSNGLKFFSQLSQTLKDKSATEKLVASITEKDTTSGKTYLKIPVEDEKVVEEALGALGTLFKMLQK